MKNELLVKAFKMKEEEVDKICDNAIARFKKAKDVREAIDSFLKSKLKGKERELSLIFLGILIQKNHAKAESMNALDLLNKLGIKVEKPKKE